MVGGLRLLLGLARAEVVEVKGALVRLSGLLGSSLASSSAAIINSAEVALTDEIHQINILVSFDLLVRLAFTIKLIQNGAIKVVLLVAIVIIRLFAPCTCATLELVSVHATAHLLRDLVYLALVS